MEHKSSIINQIHEILPQEKNMKKRIKFINLSKLTVKFAIILFIAQFASVKCSAQPFYLQPNYLNDSTIKQFLWVEKTERDSSGDGICTPFHIFTDYAKNYAKCGDVINPQLQNLINSDSIILSLFAASTLIHMGDDSEFLKIIDYMESDDEVFKDDLDSSIGYYRFSILKPYIPRMAKSKSTELRMWAVRVMADTNEEASAEILNSLLPTSSDVLEDNITHFLLKNPIKSCAEKYIQQIKTYDAVNYMRSIRVISLLTSKSQAAALIDFSKRESINVKTLAKQYKLYNPFLDFLLSNINKENLSAINELCYYNEHDKYNYHFTAAQKAKIINTYLNLIKQDENYLPYAWNNIYFLESEGLANSIRQAIKSESSQIRLSLFTYADTCTFRKNTQNNKEINSVFLDASRNSKYPDVLFNSFRYLNLLDMPYDKICSQFLGKNFTSNALSNKDFNANLSEIKLTIFNVLIDNEKATPELIQKFANKENKPSDHMNYLPGFEIESSENIDNTPANNSSFLSNIFEQIKNLNLKKDVIRLFSNHRSPIAIPFLVGYLSINDIDEVNSTLDAIDSCGNEGQQLVEYNITNPNLFVALESIKVIEYRDSFNYNLELKDMVAKALYDKILITDGRLANDLYYKLGNLDESASPYIKKLLESNNPEYIYRSLICAKQSKFSLKPELILLFEKLTAIKSKTNSIKEDKQFDEWDKSYSLLCELLTRRSYKPAQDQLYLMSKGFDKDLRFKALEILLESGFKKAISDFLPLFKEQLENDNYIICKPFFNDPNIIALISSYCKEDLLKAEIITFLEKTNTKEANACLESLLSNSNIKLKRKLGILYTLINRDNSYKKQSKRLCNILAQSKNNFLSVEQIEKIIKNPAEFMQDGQSPFGGMEIEEPIGILEKPYKIRPCVISPQTMDGRIQDLIVMKSAPHPPV